MPQAQDHTGGYVSGAFGPGQRYTSPSIIANDVILAPESGLWLRSFAVINEGASQVWWMLFDSTTLPTDGTSPIYIGVSLYPSGHASDDMTPLVQINNGIYWAASSTPGTLTYASSATLSVTIGYS